MFGDFVMLIARAYIYALGYTAVGATTRIFLESLFWAPRNGLPIDYFILFISNVIGVIFILKIHKYLDHYQK